MILSSDQLHTVIREITELNTRSARLRGMKAIWSEEFSVFQASLQVLQQEGVRNTSLLSLLGALLDIAACAVGALHKEGMVEDDIVRLVSHVYPIDIRSILTEETYQMSCAATIRSALEALCIVVGPLTTIDLFHEVYLTHIGVLDGGQPSMPDLAKYISLR